MLECVYPWYEIVSSELCISTCAFCDLFDPLCGGNMLEEVAAAPKKKKESSDSDSESEEDVVDWPFSLSLTQFYTVATPSYNSYLI